jgi:hypothetical protein
MVFFLLFLMLLYCSSYCPTDLECSHPFLSSLFFKMYPKCVSMEQWANEWGHVVYSVVWVIPSSSLWHQSFVPPPVRSVGYWPLIDVPSAVIALVEGKLFCPPTSNDESMKWYRDLAFLLLFGTMLRLFKLRNPCGIVWNLQYPLTSQATVPLTSPPSSLPNSQQPESPPKQNSTLQTSI